jgi:hypothetical protein
MPKRPPWPAATVASPLLFLALQGCASPMTPSDATYPPPGHFPATKNRLKDGPFRFWQHNFAVYTAATWGARVTYGPHVIKDEPDHEMTTPPEAMKPGRVQRMRAGWVGLRNFPGPVVMDWRSRDGTPLHYELDFAKLFADGLIRHDVPEHEINPDASVPDPDIIVEITDRTVRVYMRAFISLKAPRDPGNRYTNAVDENVLVFEKTL